MQRGKKDLLYLLIPLAVVTALLALWYSNITTQSTDVVSETAEWNLSALPFEDSNYRLCGPVEYIPNALLTPEEFAQREDDIVLGNAFETAQYATSRFYIIVPDGYYTLARRSPDFSERLFINGEWVLDVGQPGNSRETMVPNTGRILLTVTPKDGVIEVVQQSSNFVHRESSSHDGWHFGPPSLLRASLPLEYWENIQMGAFLALFFIHSILFLLLPTFRANLYFALFCLTWFLRTGVTGTKVFTVMFPWLPWVAKFRIEYLAFPLTAVFMVALLNAMFPGILARWFRWAVYGVSAVVAGLFVFADTLFMSYALLWCEAVYIPAILYIVVRFAMKLRRVRQEQVVFLFGVGLFLLAAVHDMFYFNGMPILLDEELAPLSMLVFTFCEAVAIFIATLRQVEEAKAQERRLALENAALDRAGRLRESMMATVSHEMRTPLTVMSVYAQMARENLHEIGVDEETTADLAMMRDESKRLAEMVNGLLELAPEQDYRQARAFFDIPPLVGQLARLCAPTLAKNNNRLEADLPQDLPPVYGHAGECTQILWNLLDNAARHTKNGVVTVRAGVRQGAVAVTVANTGGAIPPELLSTIFERRVTGSEEGTGLGLAICREIVEAHGGTIGIESSEETGTAVTFTLPTGKKRGKGNPGEKRRQSSHPARRGQPGYTGGKQTDIGKGRLQPDGGRHTGRRARGDTGNAAGCDRAGHPDAGRQRTGFHRRDTQGDDRTGIAADLPYGEGREAAGPARRRRRLHHKALRYRRAARARGRLFAPGCPCAQQRGTGRHFRPAGAQPTRPPGVHGRQGPAAAWQGVRHPASACLQRRPSSKRKIPVRSGLGAALRRRRQRGVDADIPPETEDGGERRRHPDYHPAGRGVPIGNGRAVGRIRQRKQNRLTFLQGSRANAKKPV